MKMVICLDHIGMMKMIEDEIVPTEFTDKDYDIIAQYLIDKKLGLEGVDELDY